MRIKRFIVVALVGACVVTHFWPLSWTRLACRPAGWSEHLDQKWGTGVWE